MSQYKLISSALPQYCLSSVSAHFLNIFGGKKYIEALLACVFGALLPRWIEFWKLTCDCRTELCFSRSLSRSRSTLQLETGKGQNSINSSTPELNGEYITLCKNIDYQTHSGYTRVVIEQVKWMISHSKVCISWLEFKVRLIHKKFKAT